MLYEPALSKEECLRPKVDGKGATETSRIEAFVAWRFLEYFDLEPCKNEVFIENLQWAVNELPHIITVDGDEDEKYRQHLPYYQAYKRDTFKKSRHSENVETQDAPQHWLSATVLPSIQNKIKKQIDEVGTADPDLRALEIIIRFYMQEVRVLENYLRRFK